ncbi:MAG TPA: SIMPL domain-containing protein [Wenzhouxiangellaceae bacterium]|nr:SIMPL domain-containing protein [Wenzhouxiangellaceae bacterium]
MMNFRAFLVLMCGFLPALAAAGNLPDGPYVSTSASAIEEVDPDYAVIDLRFRVVADAPDAARAATNKAQQRLVGLLEDYTDALRDHRLESMQFGEEYEFDRNQQKRVRTGFFGTFSFRLEVDDFERLGKLHYQLAGLEWNSLGNPAFKVADDEAVRNLARQRALEKAGERARALAEAQGARLGPVWGIIYEPMHDLAGRSPGVTGGGEMRPPAIRMSMAESEFELPVEPRPLRYEATVGVVYSLDRRISE